MQRNNRSYKDLKQKQKSAIADKMCIRDRAMNSLDAAIYGDRTEWIRRADEALAEFDRQAH